MKKKYVTAKDIIDKFSPYKIGDTIKLIRQHKANDNTFDEGTSFVINNIECKQEYRMRADVSDEYVMKNSHFAFRYFVKKLGSQDDKSFEIPIENFDKNADDKLTECKHSQSILAVIDFISIVIEFALMFIGNILSNDGAADSALSLAVTWIAIISISLSMVFILTTGQTFVSMLFFHLRKKADDEPRLVVKR